MKQKISLLLSIILSTTLGYYLGQKQNNQETQTIQLEDRSDAISAITVKEKNIKIQALEEQIAQLTERKELAETKLQEVEKKQNERTQSMSERFQNFANMRNDRIINSLFLNLQNSVTLSDEQLNNIEQFLQDQTQKLDDYRNSIKEGEFNWQDFRNKENELLGTDSFNDYLKEVLDEEQLTEYNQYAQQRKADQLEANAYREMSRLLRSISLSENQKNAIFSIHYDESYKNVSGNSEISSRQQEQEKLNELYKNILDDNQWIIYESTGRNRRWPR